MTPTHRDAQQAFKDAIDAGILSTNPNAANFAALYMYMHTNAAGDQFKHIMTREYLRPEVKP